MFRNSEASKRRNIIIFQLSKPRGIITYSVKVARCRNVLVCKKRNFTISRLRAVFSISGNSRFVRFTAHYLNPDSNFYYFDFPNRFAPNFLLVYFTNRSNIYVQFFKFFSKLNKFINLPRKIIVPITPISLINQLS